MQEKNRAFIMWKYTGQQRPDFATDIQPGEESVWDYPRPPAIKHDNRNIIIGERDNIIAKSCNSLRILETAGPPTFYIPAKDIDIQLLRQVQGSSFCEWKGNATYWALTDNTIKDVVAWSYTDPSSAFAAIKDHLSFYPGRIPCFVNGERVKPQPGHFYGGWVTKEIVGPWKGEPGTEHW